MYDFPEKTLLDIEPRPRGRYWVESRSEPDTKRLVKWISADQKYVCDCPWMTLGGGSKGEKDCKHIIQVRERFGKVCNLCSRKGEWEKQMPAPWKHGPSEVILYFCETCDEFLDSMYKRGVSK